MNIGIPKEIAPGENRVAMVPANVAALTARGHAVVVESGAGDAAGYPDSAYVEAGAQLSDDRDALFANAEIVLQVQGFGANNVNSEADLARVRSGQ